MKNSTITMFVFLGFLTACGGDGGGGGDPSNTMAPTATSLPTEKLVANTTTVTVTFSESMDSAVGTWLIGGDLASESDGGVWSMTNVQNDTLTIRPGSTWFASPGRSLTVNANNLAGIPVATINLTYDIYRGNLYYVSSKAVDNSGTGTTPASAKQTIMAATGAATAPATVLVNEGAYIVSIASPADRLNLTEGVSVYGGYNTDFSERDTVQYVSTIVDVSTAVSNPGLPTFAVFGGNGITSVTVIDGFTLLGSTQFGPESTAAIFLQGNASPTVQNNILQGGSGTKSSSGIQNSDDASPVVKNNILNGGSGGNNSFGMLNINRSSPTVQNNSINGGNGNASYGMSNVFSSSPTVQNNRISGGSGNTSYGMHNALSSSPTVQNNSINGGSGNTSYGIRDEDSSSTVQNNTIHGGSGANIAYAIYNAVSSMSVDNNILLTRTGANAFCVYESDPGSDLLSMRNNAFAGCSTLYYDFDNGCGGGNDCTTIDQVNMLPDFGINAVGDNVSVDPMFADIDGADNDINTMDDNDWHFSMSSPLSVTQGGLNGIDEGWTFTTDMDGALRPVPGIPWSIGAYEP